MALREMLRTQRVSIEGGEGLEGLSLAKTVTAVYGVPA